MRTVLIGSDFVYNKDGNLVPVEINTSIGWDKNKPETDDEVFDLTDLMEFVSSNGFTKVSYIGGSIQFDALLSSSLNTANIEYELVRVQPESITIPYVEDTESHLIIRSAYDTTAIIDDTYCKDKINFLSLIQNESFGAQFAYLDENNALVNNITSIPDNGVHPNFILKAVLPQYDKEVYPKLYRVSTQEELDVVLQNVDADYFLMEYYFNESKTQDNHIKLFRGLNLLFPPNLESISLGGYTRYTGMSFTNACEINETTFEILEEERIKYLTSDYDFNIPKLMDTDYVQLADGTFVSGADLQVGDNLKTIDIINPEEVDIIQDNVNYHINYEEFTSGSTYSTNMVTRKKRVERWVKQIKLTFTDDTEWLDTRKSNYLTLKNGEIRFLTLKAPTTTDVENSLQIGDSIVLVNTESSDGVPVFTLKEISNIEELAGFFGGWEITVEREHLFLTKSEENNTSYVAIEHNALGCYYSPMYCFIGATCPKSWFCCGLAANCQTACYKCPS